MPQKAFYKQPTLPEFVAPEKPIPPLPEKIGPYKIESLLSKGGMSLLYLGVDPQTKQTLVIKVLSPEYVTHPEMMAHFLQEAKVITLANHPNIVKLYKEGEWEGGLYIAMEFIRGISLNQFILQQSLSLKRSLDIVLQVAYALLHLHTHGVIHRDIKPENILITEEGEVKVIDFGIAQLHDEPLPKSPGGSGVMGTPHYMSPEQKEDPMHVSYSSDIYSLGIIAYELIMGRLSYGLLNLSHLPKGLRRILEKSLAVSPNERYRDIVDFISDITAYLKSDEIDKERPGSDLQKEFLESIQKAQQSLSATELPNWPQVEMGISKYRGGIPLGFYYDFFRLPNNVYGIVIAETTSSQIDSALFIATLRGMVHLHLFEKFRASKETFSSLELINTLNQSLCEDSMRQQFALGLLLLDPLRDQLSFISCGDGGVFHLTAGSNAPRKLISDNPPLGKDPFAEFQPTNDNWNVGDTIVLHCLEPTKELDAVLTEAISENRLLSASLQAEAIMKKMTLTPALTTTKRPKVLISLERIS